MLKRAKFSWNLKMFDSRDVWATGEGEDSAHTKLLCEHDAKSSCSGNTKAFFTFDDLFINVTS